MKAYTVSTSTVLLLSLLSNKLVLNFVCVCVCREGVCVHPHPQPRTFYTPSNRGHTQNCDPYSFGLQFVGLFSTSSGTVELWRISEHSMRGLCASVVFAHALIQVKSPPPVRPQNEISLCTGAYGELSVGHFARVTIRSCAGVYMYAQI